MLDAGDWLRLGLCFVVIGCLGSVERPHASVALQTRKERERDVLMALVMSSDRVVRLDQPG